MNFNMMVPLVFVAPDERQTQDKYKEGPGLLCSTVFIFSYFSIFLFWVVR